MKLGKLLKEGARFAMKHPKKLLLAAAIIAPGAAAKVSAKVAEIKGKKPKA